MRRNRGVAPATWATTANPDESYYLNMSLGSLRFIGYSLAVAVAISATSANAQRGGGGFRGFRYAEEPNAPYDGRYTFVRLRYEMGLSQNMDMGFRRGGGMPPWAHDFPRGERNFTRILDELTTVRPRTEESVVLAVNDPELFKYPVSYMSEPGFWRPSDGELAGFRTYLLKGGFVIFDDFRASDWYNLEEQMRRALPELRFLKIDGTHPIFDAFYRVPNPESLTSYGEYAPTFWAIFEDNDPRKRMIALANRDNDLSEYWEFSGTGMDPIDLTNESFKLGINYIVYALSR